MRKRQGVNDAIVPAYMSVASILPLQGLVGVLKIAEIGGVGWPLHGVDLAGGVYIFRGVDAEVAVAANIDIVAATGL